MKQATIGIVAPMFDEGGRCDSDFVLRFEEGRYELTLENIEALLVDGGDVSRLRLGREHTATIAAEHYLTGLLRSHGYNTVSTNQADEASLRRLAQASPVAVCVSTTMLFSPASLRAVVARIRAAMPETLIVLGGVFVWKAYRDPLRTGGAPATPASGPSGGEAPPADSHLFPCTRRDVDADVMVVAPHGSSMLLDVLRELEKGSRADYATIPNLALPQGDGEFVFTPRVVEPVDYDGDFTRWDLVDELPSYIPVRTSIGCPYRCRFCDFCHLYPKLTLRSRESLAEELGLIAGRKGRRLPIVHVTDDIVFINRRRLREVCATIREAKAGILWGGFLRASRFLPEEIDTLRESRFAFGFMGVESGDQGQLDRMDKKQKVEILKTSIEALDQAGMHILMTFVAGFPGETQQTLSNTIRFLNELDVANTAYQVYPLGVPTMSGLADPELRAQFGLRGWGDTWSHETMDRAQAEEACYRLFREARWVPYKYYDESILYNRRWDRETLRRIFDLRRNLTIQVIEGEPPEAGAATLAAIGREMGLAGVSPSAAIVKGLIPPRRLKGMGGSQGGC